MVDSKNSFLLTKLHLATYDGRWLMVMNHRRYPESNEHCLATSSNLP